MSINKLKVLGFSVFLTGCGQAGERTAPPARVTVAPLANDGCPGQHARGLPPEVDAVVIEVYDAAGERVQRAWFARDDPAISTDELLVERVPTGQGHTATLYGCRAGRAVIAARSAPFDVASKSKALVTMRFERLDTLGCTGTGLGPTYDDFAGLGRARVFAAAARLPDGRVFIAGGADSVTGGASDLLLSDSGGPAGFDVFDPSESLFLPGFDRAHPRANRPLRDGRIAAAAFPEPDGQGVLVVGGAPRVRWKPGKLGPLAAENGVLADPFAERVAIDPAQSAPVRGALLPRFMPAAAQDAAGTILLAGGVTGTGDAAAPSDAVEVISGRALLSGTLDQGRVGASATALAPGRFLVWGGDVGDCGQHPAVLVEASPSGVERRVLPIVNDEAAPTCPVPANRGCRTWWATAYHRAVLLEPAGESSRVLITGGLELRPDAVENSSDIGGAGCDPNAFVVEIPPALDRVTIHPVEVVNAAKPLLKRALHGVSRSGSRVLINGGWVRLDQSATALNAAQEVALYEEVAGAPAGRITPAPYALSAPRLGHVSVALDHGGVLFAGGISRAPGSPVFTLSTSAASYASPGPADACAEP